MIGRSRWTLGTGRYTSDAARDGLRTGLPNGHSQHMKAPDLAPLAAWILWEMLFDEPEPTTARRTDSPRQEPSEVKTPPRSQ